MMELGLHSLTCLRGIMLNYAQGQLYLFATFNAEKQHILPTLRIIG
jgi:hypothetical protein